MWTEGASRKGYNMLASATELIRSVDTTLLFMGVLSLQNELLGDLAKPLYVGNAPSHVYMTEPSCLLSVLEKLQITFQIVGHH